MLVWLTACALDDSPASKPGGGADTHELPSETGDGEDSSVDSGPAGETAETGEPAETADTADTADSGAPCAGTSALLTIDSMGTEASSYATLLVPDLDGGGAPDVVYESWAPARGVAFLRGEDIRAGSTASTAFWPARLETAPASFTAGPAGDLDGDGVGEVLVGQGGESGRDARLDVWSPVSRRTLGAVVVTNLSGGAYFFPPSRPTPDLDGDALPDVAVELRASSSDIAELLVFRGSVLAGGGEHTRAEAYAVVKGALSSTTTGPDLDGDGIVDMLVEAGDGEGQARLLLLPAELAATGGTFTVDDLPRLVDASGGIKRPLTIDTSGDDHDELYVMRGTDTATSVLGYSGTDLLEALSTGTALVPDDATVRLEGSGDDYLGANLAAYTDDTCALGLAASAHMADTVYFASNTILRSGGVVSVATLDARTRRGEWYGYVAAGGQDLDGDGSLDVIVGDADGGIVDLLLGVGWM